MLYYWIYINEFIISQYNKEYYFFFEFIKYEYNYIEKAINIKQRFMKTKNDIKNDIFVYINHHHKKWYFVTKDKILLWLNPMYFLIFLLYELEIQWLINHIFKYIYTSCIIKIYLIFIPFLYWYDLNNSHKLYFYFITKNIGFIIFNLKNFYSYIYIYLIPYFIGFYANIIYYKTYNYLYSFKIILLYLKKYIISIIIYIKKNIIINSISWYYELIFMITLFLKHDNINTIINLITLLLKNIIINYISKINYYIYIYLSPEIYLYINIYEQCLSDFDILYTYLRINKYKLYKWDKYSKKKIIIEYL